MFGNIFGNKEENVNTLVASDPLEFDFDFDNSGSKRPVAPSSAASSMPSGGTTMGDDPFADLFGGSAPSPTVVDSPVVKAESPSFDSNLDDLFSNSTFSASSSSFSAPPVSSPVPESGSSVGGEISGPISLDDLFGGKVETPEFRTEEINPTAPMTSGTADTLASTSKTDSFVGTSPLDDLFIMSEPAPVFAPTPAPVSETAFDPFEPSTTPVVKEKKPLKTTVRPSGVSSSVGGENKWFKNPGDL